MSTMIITKSLISHISKAGYLLLSVLENNAALMSLSNCSQARDVA